MQNNDIVGGKYRIDQLIGAGGWSKVYRATHVELKTHVAIKFLDTALATHPRALERFKQEAEIVCRWNNRNIVPVRDFGFTKDDQPYLVMDYIDGPTLSKFIKDNGPLPYKRALAIFSQCCSALQFAHSQGILHRDIKPGNVLLRFTPEDGEIAMVSDFGLAKSIDETASNLTQTGETVGTPHYMSPELCVGTRADERSDIYSFGCLMYEALTGKKPFDSEHVVLIVDKHLNAPTPSFRTMSPIVKIPGRVERIVMKCMQKKADDRFRSFSDLQKVIDQSLQHPILAEVDSLGYLVSKVVRSKSFISGAAAVALLCIISTQWKQITQLTATPSTQQPTQQSPKQPEGKKKSSMYPVQHVTTADWINRADNARRKEDYSTVAQACSELIKRVSDYGATVYGAESLSSLSEDLIRLARFKDAQPVLEQTLSFTNNLGPDAAPSYDQAAFQLARVLAALGNYQRSDKLLKEAMDDTKQTYGTRHPNYAQALIRAGDVYHQSKHYKQSADAYRQAIAMISKTSEITDPTMIDIHGCLARSLAADNRLDDATTEFNMLLKALDKSQEPSVKSRIYSMLGEIAERKGDFNKARTLFETAIKTQEASGRITPEYANLLAHYSHFLDKHKFPGAEEPLAKAEKLDKLMGRPVYDNLIDAEPQSVVTLKPVQMSLRKSMDSHS